MLCCAWQGLTAALMKRRVGRALTADKIITTLEMARHKWERSERRRAEAGEPPGDEEDAHVKALQPRVLLVDEFSNMNTLLVARLVRALFKNGAPLESLVFMGDVRQNPPIERAALMPPFVSLYGKCALTQLSVNFRVSSASQVLLHNLDCWTRGDIRSLQYSTDLASDHPFVFIERPSSLVALSRLLAPFVECAEPAQILVQRNEERRALNRLYCARDERVMRLLYSTRAYSDTQPDFCVGERVMFLQNADSSPRSVPAHLAASSVKNGMIGRVVEVRDVCVGDGTLGPPLEHTASPLSDFGGRDSRRLLVYVLEGDERAKRRRLFVGAASYMLAWLVRVYACTIGKFQGCEARAVVVYLHEGIALSSTFEHSDGRVALSRARERVILVSSMRPLPECGGLNELEVLSRRDTRTRFEMLAEQLPSASELGLALVA